MTEFEHLKTFAEATSLFEGLNSLYKDAYQGARRLGLRASWVREEKKGQPTIETGIVVSKQNVSTPRVTYPEAAAVYTIYKNVHDLDHLIVGTRDNTEHPRPIKDVIVGVDPKHTAKAYVEIEMFGVSQSKTVRRKGKGKELAAHLRSSVQERLREMQIDKGPVVVFAFVPDKVPSQSFADKQKLLENPAGRARSGQYRAMRITL